MSWVSLSGLGVVVANGFSLSVFVTTLIVCPILTLIFYGISRFYDFVDTKIVDDEPTDKTTSTQIQAEKQAPLPYRDEES